MPDAAVVQIVVMLLCLCAPMCLFANNAPNVYDVIIAKNKILRGASHENPKFTFSVTSVCNFFFLFHFIH